ncbi:P47 [Carcinus maenas nudivirus]|uniref:P47 n=1 Tax=Carcinus maenas nudivirus TaxID=2880837 RepID=A0AAE8Y3E5_9VIRU|nr:P47 [Carcinus maenas nudivirus]UBZ25598.1 P47 [Carcinus maenas nudivirus]
MALNGEYSKIHLLFTDLTKELITFTNSTNVSNVCKIVNCLYNVEPEVLVRVMLSLRNINREKLLEKKDKYAQVYFKEISKLITSKNHLDNSDTHSIGQDLSIFSCARKSQDVLNVKRLKNKKTNEEGGVTNTPLVAYVLDELNLKNESIQPTVKDSSLHKHEITWFRLMLCGDFLESLRCLYEENPIIAMHLYDIHIVSEEYNVVEIYYKKKAKLAQLMLLFNDSEYVKEIIFCSELESVKKLKIRPCDIFSNMLKFYYCYKTNNITFTITCMDHMKKFHFVYLMCSIFIHSSRFTSSDGAFSPLPLSRTSYYKPMVNIIPKTRVVEDISDYEKTYVTETGDLSETAASFESYELKKRHRLYNPKQDRDQRILHGFGAIGGINQTEVVLHASNELQTTRNNIMMELSDPDLL